MRLIRALLRLVLAAFAIGAAALAILAFLGFASPELDVLNHLQPFIFTLAVLGLAITLAAFHGRRWRPAIIAFSATGFILSASVVVPETVSAFLPRDPLPADDRPVLKAMTLNLFGLNYQMERVRDFIAEEQPDIIAFQEYFPEQRGPLHPMIVGDYPYYAHCVGGKRANIALYARIPFTFTDSGACSEAASGVRTARIVASFSRDDGTRFSVVTTHLDWPLPAARQREQMHELAEAVENLPGPLIVMADFNSTPWSYGLRGLVAETGTVRHTRNLVTYPLTFTLPMFTRRRDGLVPLLPFLPLDHVLTRNGVAVHALWPGSDVNSDHLPVLFTFSVAPTPG